LVRQATFTTICWMPLEPSGKDDARTGVCTVPSLPVARTASWWLPGFASHGRYHCLQ
jgi:hypothetical protein